MGTAALAEVIKFNTAIREVSLANTVLNSQGCALLADALIMNRTLSSLNLEKNRVGAAGARYLAAALRANESLRRLSLDGNDIGDGGAISIAAALAPDGGSRLERLSLANTGLTEEGAAALGSALAGNVWLRRLVVAKLELEPQVLQGREGGGEGEASTHRGLQVKMLRTRVQFFCFFRVDYFCFMLGRRRCDFSVYTVVAPRWPLSEGAQLLLLRIQQRGTGVDWIGSDYSIIRCWFS